ncbi:uncharacterized protein Dana_GF24761 [Drosophila ananassae]|uniref:DUF229 domain-containing protein n=1 Tax=Drosophila ananassae TaxID=7217 RepID=B3M8H2_DROAN|nr:uncharacterized protein Dana_GF24761 [Drosophila ananassae]
MNKTSPLPKNLPKYFVDSEYCKMPYVDPFSSDIMSSFKKKKFKLCHKDHDLITPEFDEKLKLYRLHIHKHLVKKLLKRNEDSATLECYYHKITRSLKYMWPDDTYGDVNFITTGCSVQNKSKVEREIQTDGLAFIQDRLTDKEVKLNRKNMSPEKEQVPKPSVIIMGLDSTSRMNFQRTMPKVLKYVRQDGWFEMQGYNKVGDNTLPNLLAVLAGTSRERADKSCNLRSRDCLDKVNFIWKRYKKNKYTTAFAEDCEAMSTFNYMLPGFVHQPVDYYLRPFLLAAEEKFHINSYLGRAYCVGRHLSFRYVWDFGQLFIQRFLQKSPIFGMLWSNSFTHDVFTGATALDDLLKQYMDNFQQMGLFNRSVVIFMSDHGYRYNTLRDKKSGFLEERLPMVFIYVPPWFREKYPQFVENLKNNKNRLSSNYDLHMTLHHLLQLNSTSMADFDRKLQPVECHNCQSLFFELPFNRSCREAGISDKWCTCQPSEEIRNPKDVSDICEAIVERLNQHLLEKHLSNMCHEFRLGNIRSAHRRSILSTPESPADKDEHIYTIEFWTLPRGLFEATVRWNRRIKELTMNVEQLSRLNRYDKDAKCMKVAHMKKYCICRDAL